MSNQGNHQQGVVAVGTSPTPIVTTSVAGTLTLQNNGTVAVFIGASNVAATGPNAGPSIAANGGTISIIVAGDVSRTLYGIVASGTANVAYLSLG